MKSLRKFRDLRWGEFRVRKALLSVLVFACCSVGAAWSQATYQPGDRVEVDVIMAGAPERAIYRPGTVMKVEGEWVFVRLDNGEERRMPLNSARTHWVKPAGGNQTAVNPPPANRTGGTAFSVGQRVDVDVIMAGTPDRAIYRPGTVMKVEGEWVFVRLDNGEERRMPLKSARTYWVKPAGGNQTAVNPPPANQSAANQAGPAPSIAITNPPAQPPPAKEDPKPAGLGAPPSGIYNAHKISPGGQLMGLGKLEIQGNTYRGIAGGSFSPYTVAGDGNITWSRGLTGMPNGWTYVRSVYVGKDYKGRPLIKVYYRSTSGWNDAFDCVLGG